MTIPPAHRDDRDARSGSRPTIKDVASNLGLSPATVSLALNGKGTIASSTRSRVVAEAVRLGYEAHPFARGLRGGKSGVIALSVRSLDAGATYRPVGVDHFSRMVGAAAFSALERGFGLMLAPYRTGQAEREAPLWVDGYVLEDARPNDILITRLLEAGIPVVTIGWDPANKSRTVSVSTAGRDASNQILDLLDEHGARRISFVGGTERNSWNLEAEGAYRAWCRRHDMPAELVRVPESAGEQGGADIAEKLLDGIDPPDAVYCQTGRHAAGLAAAARRRRLRIPADLMIAAGSDSEQTRMFNPPITAIDLQPETLGQVAIELLADILGGATVRSRVVPARVLARASTNR